MYEMEYYSGIIRLIPRRVNETVEGLCKEIMSSNGYNELPHYCHSWIEYLRCMSDKIIYSNGELYEILNKDFIGTKDTLLSLEKIKNDTYKFEILYNAHFCGFKTMLKRMLDMSELNKSKIC